MKYVRCESVKSNLVAANNVQFTAVIVTMMNISEIE
jgi:hypothetical protein